MHLRIPANFNSRIINTYKNHILGRFSSDRALDHVCNAAQNIARSLPPTSIRLFHFRASRTTGCESRFTDHAQ
jgi:hypothetical protein